MSYFRYSFFGRFCTPMKGICANTRNIADEQRFACWLISPLSTLPSVRRKPYAILNSSIRILLTLPFDDILFRPPQSTLIILLVKPSLVISLPDRGIIYFSHISSNGITGSAKLFVTGTEFWMISVSLEILLSTKSKYRISTPAF